MKTIVLNVIFATMMLVISAPLLQAAETGGAKAMAESGMAGMAKDQPEEKFLKTQNIDAYQVSFMVTKTASGMEHGGSHNLMVKVEKDGTPQTLTKIFAKVILANGESKKEPLFKMDDWYMNGFDLGSSGKHQIIILFKTADGLKHNGGVYYQAEEGK